ncbi:MAG: hypothetical protein V4864_12120 [Pseudomonadota bacterium]
MRLAILPGWCLGVCLLLAGCGGGNEGTPDTRPALPAQAAVVPDAAALMDWAQAAYPSLFPGAQPTVSAAPFLYRYYPQTGNYLGVAGTTVFVLGPVSNGALMTVGSLADFACRVDPAGCQPPPDATDPSGTYTAYATNGLRFTLVLDVPRGSFSFTGLTIPSYASAGAIAPDPATARGYRFQGAAANTGFRYADGLIVGSYDFGDGAKPFVAGRHFAASIAEAVGTYDNLGVTRSAAGTPDSAIYTSRIDTDGMLRICNHNTIYRIELCPESAVLRYSLSVADGTFHATALTAGRGDFNFRVAKAGSENIYLMGAVTLSTGEQYFRIGVLERTQFTSGTAQGGTTWGEWGTASFTGSSYSSTGIAADGHGIGLNGSLASMGTLGPTGMRAFHSGGSGFAVQGAQLAVLVGARNSVSAGYMQIGAR